MIKIKMSVLLMFAFLVFFQTTTQGQIFERFSKLIAPSSDTSNWELIEIEKINCAIKMPGQPTLNMDSTFVNGRKIPFYSVNYDAGFIESLEFELYVTEFPPNLHSDSLSQKELEELYREEINDVVGFLSDDQSEFKKIQLAGYSAMSSKATFFKGLVKLEYAVVLIKNTFYTFSIYYDTYPATQVPYFYHSFKILTK